MWEGCFPAQVAHFSPLLVARAAARGGGGSYVCANSPPKLSSSKFRTERLWKDFFRNPSLWWDRRNTKTNPNSPDFLHKNSRDSLWLDAWDNPSWVRQMLRGLDLINQVPSLQDSLPSAEEELCSKEASLLQNLGKNAYSSISVDAHGTAVTKASSKEDPLKSAENLAGDVRVDVQDNILTEACLEDKLPKVQEEEVNGYTTQVDCSVIEEAHQNGKVSKAEEMCGTIKMGVSKEEKEACDNITRELKVHDNARKVGGIDIDWEELSVEEALSSLENGSVHQPAIPNIYTVLRKCSKEKKHSFASRLHAYVHRRGLETHTLLGNQLVQLLVDAGNLLDAQQVFDGLVNRRKRTWNFLITGYVQCGKPHQALHLYERMQEESSADPDPLAFVALLKCCADLKYEEIAGKVHDHIVRTGVLERDCVVGNALVNMYMKFSLLAKAQEVFNSLPLRNAVTWNTLIAGYAKYGQGEQALECLEQMRGEGIAPNRVTYICSMKACGSIGDVNKCLELHAEIARVGVLETDLHVSSALVDMYAKAGFVSKAQEAFDMLPRRDIVSWNALIAGYVQCDCCAEALTCFKQLQQEGMSPDPVTFISCLKACGGMRALEKGKEIHREVERKGMLEKNPIIGTALVNMYAKCGQFTEAQEVFDNLLTRDVISWSALISAYAEHGHGEEALDCFEQMEVEGICPNAITLISTLKACGSIGAIDEGQEIHAEVARKGLLETDPLLGSTLVDMYGKCGLLLKAREVLDGLPIRNVISWNAFVTGFVQCGRGREALLCFERMQTEGVLPDAITYVSSLKACGSIGDPVVGHRLHSQFMKEGLKGQYLAAGNALVDMYSKCGLLTEAQEVFDELPARDIVSWNALLAGYAQNELGDEAIKFFEQMQLESFSPDLITYVSSLKASGTVGALAKGEEIHAQIAKDEMLERDVVIGNALIDMYAKCGSLHKAQDVFDSLTVQDTVAWTALIAGYAQLGEIDNVLDLFKKMINEGVKPNLVTFVGILNACSHAGLVEKGQIYFEAMNEVYDTVPISEHHACMVDLLCRAGQLELAVSMIKKMLLLPDPIVWHTVLGACQKWNNVKLGREVFEHLVQLDNDNMAAYISIINIYANLGRKDVGRTKASRTLRVARSSTREQECCWWVDASSNVHPFSINSSHSRNMMLDKVLLERTHVGSYPASQGYPCDIKENLCCHTEMSVVGCALNSTPHEMPIHIVKNSRVCIDCHTALALVSKNENRRILCKDVFCFHIFKDGMCICERDPMMYGIY